MATEPKLAFIRRYSCLYTRDLTKKAKAWHDGYLVLHHMNAKIILLSDKFITVDECFYRVPGAKQSFRDVPKTFFLTTDAQIAFDRHLATVDEAVFEEEQDVSEIYVKKRKDVTELDDFVASDDEEGTGSSARPAKRTYSSPATSRSVPGHSVSTATSISSASGRASTSKPGWFTRNSDNTSARSSIDNNGSSPFQYNQSSSNNTGLRGQILQIQARQANTTPLRNRTSLTSTANRQDLMLTSATGMASPKAIAPFRPPSLLSSANSSSEKQARSTSSTSSAHSPRGKEATTESSPASSARRTLGTTRPSASARLSLQNDWAKFAEKHPVPAASKPKQPSGLSRSYGPGSGSGAGIKSSNRWSGSSVAIPDFQDRRSEESRKQHMDQIMNQPEPEIIQVNEKRRDGEEGDTGAWLF